MTCRRPPRAPETATSGAGPRALNKRAVHGSGSAVSTWRTSGVTRLRAAHHLPAALDQSPSALLPQGELEVKVGAVCLSLPLPIMKNRFGHRATVADFVQIGVAVLDQVA